MKLLLSLTSNFHFHWQEGDLIRFLQRLVSSSSRKLGREQQQQKRNDRRGGEKWRKRLPTNLTILKNCVRPRTQRLIGAVLVVLILSTRHINQSRYALFTCVADLVSFDLWSQITNALDWCLFESCLCQGSKSSKYNWRSSSGDKGRPIYWEWRRANLTGKNGLF